MTYENDAVTISIDPFDNYAQELRLDELESIETPASNDFWTGFFLGFGAVIVTAAFIVAVIAVL